MRKAQLPLEKELVDAIDRVARKLGTTRSGFTREALRAALARADESEKEQKHRDGYMRRPPTRGEFQPWEKEQVWGEL